MKRIITLFLCFVLGAVCLTGCTNKDEPFTQKSYTAEGEEITEVYIDVQDRQIEVMISPDNLVHIDYFENSKEYYDISVSNTNILTMTAESDKEWRDYIGLKADADSRKILVQLPDSLLTEVKLSTTNEDIKIPKLNVVGNVLLSSEGGNIVFDKLSVQKSINISAKNGDISGLIIGSYDDYVISSYVKKGDSNLPSSKDSGEKKLTVSNNNGDIDIEFTGEKV